MTDQIHSVITLKDRYFLINNKYLIYTKHNSDEWKDCFLDIISEGFLSFGVFDPHERNGDKILCPLYTIKAIVKIVSTDIKYIRDFMFYYGLENEYFELETNLLCEMRQ